MLNTTSGRAKNIVDYMKSHLIDECGYKPIDVNSDTFKLRGMSLEKIAISELENADEEDSSREIAISTIDAALLHYNEKEYERNMVEFSLYPLAYAIARVKLNEELPEISLRIRQGGLQQFRNAVENNPNLENIVGCRFEGGNSLYLYWSLHRKQWVAFDVMNIPVDMMYGETNYSYAQGLNDNLRAKLLETYNIQPAEKELVRVEMMSPKELLRLQGSKYKIIKMLKRMLTGERK